MVSPGVMIWEPEPLLKMLSGAVMFVGPPALTWPSVMS